MRINHLLLTCLITLMVQCMRTYQQHSSVTRHKSSSVHVYSHLL
jgi:hypothetical protein